MCCSLVSVEQFAHQRPHAVLAIRDGTQLGLKASSTLLQKRLNVPFGTAILGPGLLANTLLGSASASIRPVMISRLARSVRGRALTKAPSMLMIICFASLSGFRFSVISCRISSSMRSPTAINRARVLVWVVPPVGGRSIRSRSAALR
jgi:hypothetical protein